MISYTEAKEVLKKMLKVYVHEQEVKEALIIAIKCVAEKDYCIQELARLKNEKERRKENDTEQHD